LATVSRISRHDLRHPDGRRVYLYGSFQPPPTGYRAEPGAAGVYERRWNPLRREWVLVAAARQGRTFLPQAKACPLCPARAEHPSEVPAARFHLAVFENRFPAMGPSSGSCEVVVCTDRHEESLASLDEIAIRDLVEVWTDRYRDLGARPEIDYVFIFENRGEAVGVTLHHPHGQIYGYPFIPPVAEIELRAARAYRRWHGRCLQCSLILEERKASERLLFAAKGIAAYVPRYARWPYEVHVAPIRHRGALPELSRAERWELGAALQRVASAYDRLFDRPMPYMMAMHQRPTDGRPHPEAHLRVEFYPLLRTADRLKFLAGGECGAGTFVCDGLPEEKASELSRVLSR
jgi:UDPglucose--hexose-1-phosphate uridylyltransferase